MSFFANVEQVPGDPILGLTEAYNADTRPTKVNLGVGIYYDENGRIPLLRCVYEIEQKLALEAKPRGYLPIDGMPAYTQATRELLFGADSPLLEAGRVATTQTVGGSGALRVGAEILHSLLPFAKVAISKPSWENHRAVFGAAGFEVLDYTYFDPATHGLDFDGMLADLRKLEPGTTVLLHACCHNPTGADLTAAQWAQVAGLLKERGLFPFVDMAYQGFGHGIAEDGAVIGKFVAAGLNFFVSTSFSKSFSLYGERVGALSVLCQNKEEADRVMSQLKIVIRTNYSNPQIHGATVVATVLNTPALRAQWEQELAEMRVRIKAMRQALVDGLKAAGVKQDMSFITGQIGMFSYSGLTKDQMVRLRNEFGVYGTDTGRMCVAALNSKNIAHVCASIAKVL